MPYLLQCTRCSFQETADDVDAAFDMIDAHREERGKTHHVDFELVEEEPLLRGGDSDTDP